MFNGFTDATADFLWGIRFNNEKEWFLEHKQEYTDSLWTPFKALAGEVYEGFSEKQPDLGLNLHISRIYRDARRLHGRGPYKDHLWFSMRQENDNWVNRPVFWFELSPEGYAYGLGVYAPLPAVMARFRRELDEAPLGFVPLAENMEKQKTFSVSGEEYARKKGSAEPPLDSWYNRKNIDIVCSRKADKLLKSPRLVKELIKGFDFLVPYYNYFERIINTAE